MQSHPSWVCGLKLRSWKLIYCRLSHTLRGCVDWNCLLVLSTEVWASHTLRGCVDWNIALLLNLIDNRVTPFVGVWIETVKLSISRRMNGVTPFVGVWIETAIKDVAYFDELGHTLRGCVDWNFEKVIIADVSKSHTLRGCVDWNNVYGDMYVGDRPSHPSWVCGLKQSWVAFTSVAISHTLRGCVDWNNTTNGKLVEYLVTPFVGVWIETDPRTSLSFSGSVTPFVGVWIETWKNSSSLCHMKSHPSWVCGLKLQRNEIVIDGILVTPFVGVWIETRLYRLPPATPSVTPFVGVWIETHCSSMHQPWP